MKTRQFTLPKSRKVFPILTFLLLLANIHFGQSAKEPIGSWLILGPFPVTEDRTTPPAEELQKAWFQKEALDPTGLTDVKAGATLAVAGKSFQWKKAAAENELLNLDRLFDSLDFAYAYAFTTIEAPEAGEQLVGIGSDDAVKVWLNGKLVHENWIPRAHRFKEDLVVLPMKKGRNTLLVKVQDMQYDWALSVQFLQKADFPDLLVESASRGMIDQAKLLLDHGADPNQVGENGWTPWQIAKVKGRKETAEYLASRGAKSDAPWPSNEEQVDRLFRQVTQGIQPGAAVLVAQNGKILLQKGYGYADREAKIPVTTETQFRIGSITKQFVASAILKLYEEGKLDLQDKLSKYLPDFPRGDEVTIHHLLTHTSGIHSYTNEASFVDRVTAPISEEELIAEIRRFDYDFNPGESWNYNNSGYFLLGHLVGKISGMPYGAYLKKSFFDPLGMTSTGVYRKGLNLAYEAKGYSFENGTVNQAKDWDMSWAGGAGSLYSTVGDLYRWNEAVFNGKVLKAETLNTAFSPVKLNNGELPSALGQGGYGYGWMIAEFRKVKEIGHGGGLHGFVTHLARYPEQNLTVIVLTNCAPPQYINPEATGRDLAEILAWKQLGAQASFSTAKQVNVDLYDDYAGSYEYPGGAIMVISREGDRLFAQLATQPKSEIFPKSDHEFFWKVVDAQIVFERDANGKVTQARHTQGGQSFAVPRIEPEKTAAIDPAIYDNYVGEYALGPMTLTVSRQGDQLFIQPTGQSKVEIFPRSKTEFFPKVIKALITFQTDAGGKATQLTLDQGGVKQVAARKN